MTSQSLYLMRSHAAKLAPAIAKTAKRRTEKRLGRYPLVYCRKMLDLSHIVAMASAKTGLEPAKLRLIYSAVFEEITDALARDEVVSLRYLGRFKVHEYPSKSIPDPKGRGHMNLMLPTKVIKFRPSPHFRHAVEENKGHLVSEPTEETRQVKKIPAPVNLQQAPATKPQLEEHEHEVAIKLAPKSLTKGPVKQTPEPVEEPAITSVPKLAKPVIMSGDVKITQEIKHETTAKPQPDTAIKPIDNEEHGITGWWHRLTGQDNDQAVEAKAETEIKADVEQKLETVKLSTSTDTTNPPEKNVETTKVALKAIKQPSLPKIEETLNAKTNVDFMSLANLKVPKEILNLLPELFARRHKAVPVSLDGHLLTVAMVNPEDLEVIQLIQKTTGLDIKPALSSTEDISLVLNQYSALETEVANVIKDADIDISKQELIDAEKEDVEDSGDDSPTARIVFSLLRRAVREKASDVHIEPQDNNLQIRFRLDGVLHQRLKLPLQIQQAVLARLKILANLKIDEHRLPQDGRFQLDIDKNLVDFRLSIMPVADGEKAVMRVLDKTQGLLTLEEIGVRGSAYDVISKNIKKTYGMTLITGPTGSGKTTSLYALLGLLMDDSVNIVTMENPIEYRIAGINQSQVNPDIGYDFADGLRAIVRQDPDIVMVGEIRDKDTAEIAIQSALTGHIVLSTLHTNTAAGAFPRLIDMGVEPFLISSSVNTVVAQRLARKICDHCREPYNPSATELEVVKEEIAKVPDKYRPKIKKFTFFKGKGCDSCNQTGYKGRVGIFEVLNVTEEVKEAVISRSTDSVIQQIGVKQGTILMLPDGLLKAIDGITTLEEVWRVTRD